MSKWRLVFRGLFFYLFTPLHRSAYLLLLPIIQDKAKIEI